jgi:O-antigen/teichoic acid export membrane protein
MKKAFYYSLAVGSSLVSKLSTTMLQLVLTPLAAVALGVEGFALYVMLIATSGWLAITSLGLGPILTVQVALNVVDGSPNHEQVLVASAFWASIALSTLTVMAATAVVFSFPADQIFGPQFGSRSSELTIGFLMLTAVYFLQTNLSIFEAVQAGLQRQHTTNLSFAMGALATLPVAFVVAKPTVTAAEMLAAGLLPTIFVRSVHVMWLILKRTSIIPSWYKFDLKVVKNLVSRGAIYSLAGGAGNFISHALPIILIGRVLDPEQTGAFAATLYLIILFSGVTTMIVSPAIPAIASSLAQRDNLGMRDAYKKLLLASLGFSFVAAFVLALAGEYIFEVWLRGTVRPDKALLVSAGAYFVLSTWEVVHFSILVALNKVASASLLVFTRSVVGAILTQAILPTGEMITPFIAMCFAILLVDSVPLYLLVKSGIRGGMSSKSLS